MAKDFRLKISVSNDRLLTLIEEKFGSQAEMSRKTGINASKISALVTMRDAPTSSNGWTRQAEDIASALGVFPSEVWPEHMESVRLSTRTAELSLDVNDIGHITGERNLDVLMLSDLVEKGRQGLSKRESAFLDWLLTYGYDATFDEKAKALGVSRERARQVEVVIMRKMQKKLEKAHNVRSLF